MRASNRVELTPTDSNIGASGVGNNLERPGPREPNQVGYTICSALAFRHIISMHYKRSTSETTSKHQPLRLQISERTVLGFENPTIPMTRIPSTAARPFGDASLPDAPTVALLTLARKKVSLLLIM